MSAGRHRVTVLQITAIEFQFAMCLPSSQPSLAVIALKGQRSPFLACWPRFVDGGGNTRPRSPFKMLAFLQSGLASTLSTAVRKREGGGGRAEADHRGFLAGCKVSLWKRRDGKADAGRRRSEWSHTFICCLQVNKARHTYTLFTLLQN